MALPPEVMSSIKTAVQNYNLQIGPLTEEIQRMQRAGIDVSAFQTRLATLNENVRKLKLQYPELNS